MRQIKVKCCCCCSPPNQQNEDEDEDNRQYWNTLERLIQTKIDLDFEHSAQEDYNELRDDMKNMILKEFKRRDKKNGKNGDGDGDSVNNLKN